MSAWNLAAVGFSALSGMVLIGPAQEGAEMPQLTALKLAL